MGFTDVPTEINSVEMVRSPNTPGLLSFSKSLDQATAPPSGAEYLPGGSPSISVSVISKPITVPGRSNPPEKGLKTVQGKRISAVYPVLVISTSNMLVSRVV